MNLPHAIPSVNRQISVNFHPDKILAVKTFRPIRITSLADLARWVTDRVWSPIIYKENLRCKENFKEAWFLGFDIDDGMSLKTAIDLLENWQVTAMIGTTKSHQKEKRTDSGHIAPPCDRFRIVLWMSAQCNSVDVFEHNTTSYLKVFRADGSCADGGRLFAPCTSVVWSQEANPIDWIELPKNYYELKKASAERAENELKKHIADSTIPGWVMRIALKGFPPGGAGKKGRHDACYRVGAYMCQLGYSEEAVFELLCRGPLLTELGEKDVRKQIRDGFAKASKRGRGHERGAHKVDRENALSGVN